MKIVIKFQVGRRNRTLCRLVVGCPMIEVQSTDGLGDVTWVKATRGLPAVQDVLEAGLARFAEDTSTVMDRINPAPGRIGGVVCYYPRGVTNIDGVLYVDAGDMDARRADHVDPISGHEDKS